MTHQDAIAAITDATTTAELAAAIATFTDLRSDADPGTSPGVPDAAPDGRYYNGFHLFTKEGSSISATQVGHLPRPTQDLWTQLIQERRDQREHDDLTAEQTRGRGRPSVGRAVPVRLRAWQIALLDRDAKAAGVGRAELVRALITAGYDSIGARGSAGPERAEAIRALLDGRREVTSAAEQVMTSEDTYRVEILHPESSAWNHVHGVDWETTDSYPDAWIYAVEVARDHPGSRVRLVETNERGTTYLPVPDEA